MHKETPGIKTKVLNYLSHWHRARQELRSHIDCEKSLTSLDCKKKKFKTTGWAIKYQLSTPKRKHQAMLMSGNVELSMVR